MTDRALTDRASAAALISTIVPAYNRVEYLRAAVDSVLAQTFQDQELIIADDGSEADTMSYLAELEKRPRIKVLRLPHSGNPSAVRNRAVQFSTGTYVAFLDSDDIWLPTKLEKQLQLHQSRPERRWSYVAMERIHADGTLMQGEPRRAVPDGAIFEQLLTLTADVSMSGVMAERSLLERIGCFDESVRYFEDFDLFLRLSLQSDVSVVTEPLVRMRSHTDHYSASRVSMCEGRANLLDKMQPFAEQLGLATVAEQERTANSMDLARALAVSGRRGEALQLIWRARANALYDRAWWRACAVMLKSVAPVWVRTAYRKIARATQA